jgi:hypothetical protein
MAMDHLIEKARKHFNITKVEDWANVRPEWILKIHGVKEKTLNQIRLLLMPHGITLMDDATVDFWAKTLGRVKLGAQLSESDDLSIQPFTILVDTKEQQPWTFTAMNVGSERTVTPYRFQNLGPAHGDYSVAGCEDEIHLERKSVEDAIGTFLATPDGERARRWQETLQFLASIDFGCVMIEGSRGATLGAIQARGTRSEKTLRRTFVANVRAWTMDYHVPFCFYDTRRLAEIDAFGFLRRYWLQKQELKKSTREIDSVDDVIGSL